MARILRILLTSRCNQRCVYCHNEGQGPATRDIDYSQLCRFLDLVADALPPKIQLSGGEPLLYSKLEALVTRLSDKPGAGLVTNGTLLSDSLLDRISASFKIILSIPSLNPDQYSQVTGVSIRALLRSLDLLKRRQVKYSINTVLTELNANDILRIVDFALTEGVNLKILPQRDFTRNEVVSLPPILLARILALTEAIEHTRRGVTKYHLLNGRTIRVLGPDWADETANWEYGELRLFPDFSLARSISAPIRVSLDTLVRHGDREGLIELMSKDELWRM